MIQTQTKQLRDYFTFLRSDDIRIRGTRIGIEQILYEYIYNQKSAEAIDLLFHTVTLEQIYATILYYFQNREEVTQYVENWLKYCENAEAEHDKNPPPVVARLLKLKAENESAKVSR
ncbi:MAG: DUF433 domain-containing protein [Cyanobacteria bacterium P01_E01_bin.42]